MKDLIDRINSTFIKRTEDISAQRDIWLDLTVQFRPEISQYRTARPSTIIARETGDLGLAVLWIVQSMLIRPILKDISLNAEITDRISDLLSGINADSVCALANSESSDNPVVFTENDGVITLSGEKKFITAGANADLIIVTCRKSGEDKVSGVALLETGTLPAGSLVNLNLSIFRSVNHARLMLHEFTTDSGVIPVIDPSVVRRSLKKWGIIERALIMESFISFLIYANRVFTAKDIIVAREEELAEFLELQTESANRQLDEAMYGGKVETKNADASRLFTITGKFKEKLETCSGRFSPGELMRLADLTLFDNLKG